MAGVFAIALVLVVLAAEPAAAVVVRLTDDAAARHPDVVVTGDGTAHVAWNRHLGAGMPVPDEVVVCRVPRGAPACAATQTYALAGPLAGGPDVSLMPTGELVVTWETSGTTGEPGADNHLYAVTSTDGGARFGAPREIGNREGTIWGWEGAVEAGPGNFSLSLLGNSGGGNQGLNYSAAPLDGLTTRAAELTPDWRKAFHPSVAFVDPTTPIAAYSDLERIFFRRWSGAGDLNAVESWNEEVTVPFAGNEPRLASGIRGVHLLYSDSEAPFDYWVRPFDPAANAFGDPVMVSDDDGSSAIRRDFVQDGAGALHAVFLERPDGTTWELRHAISPPGEGWRPGERLATQAESDENLYGLRVAAAPDGGGVVVADGNGNGPVYLVPFAPTGPLAPGCPATVVLGQAVVRALAGCFEQRPDGTHVASGPVKVNGVDVEPAAGDARAAATFTVTADPEARTLRTSAAANVRVGNVVLDRATVAWRFPAGTGAVKRLGAADPSVFKDLAQHGKELFGFPVEGDAELIIGAGETARIPANFGLPALIGGVSGAVTLNTTAGGLDLDQLRITAPAAKIGLLRISGIEVTYSGADRFTGSATLELPPAYGGTFTVGFGFLDGRLNFLHYDMPFDPMLPVVAPPFVGAPPEPMVGLERLAIDYVDEPGSRRLTGSVDLVGGGRYAGLRAAALEGAVTLEFPSSGPATIDASGDLAVVGIPFAQAEARYSTDGLLTFLGSFAFPPPGQWQSIAGFSGSVSGWVSVAPPFRFSGHGSATAGVGPFSGSGEAVISSSGVSGCVSFPPLPPFGDVIPDLGVSYEWGDAFPVPVCNVGAFKLAAPTARAAANGAPVQIPAGLPQAAIEIAGAGAAPRVRVTGPDGTAVTSGPATVAEGRFMATEVPEAQRTYVTIGRPPAGGYAIEALEGSVPVTGTRLARGLPDPEVSARVTARGRGRAVRYRVRPIAGQRVTFAEQSAGGLYRELATVRRARGVVRFRPAGSRARRRTLVALVEQDGVPRARLDVARFTGPPPRVLRRPKVRARRSGRRMLVRWKKVPRARGYEVRAVVPRAGRRLLRFTGPRARSLAVRRIERNERTRVTVRAVGPDARPGRTGRAKLRARRGKRR